MKTSVSNPKSRWILLRGWTREARHWELFPKVLSEITQSEVITLDLPGVGTENKIPSPPNIAEITEIVRARYLKEEDPRTTIPTYCLGISMGGMVAIEWCDKWPEDFKGLVLINSSLANLSPPWQRLRLKNLGEISKLVRTDDPEALEAGVLNLTSSLNTNDKTKLSKVFAKYAVETPLYPGTWFKQILAAFRYRPKTLPHLKTLILSSAKDKLVSSKCSKALAEAMNAPQEIHPTAGHDLTLDDPTWVAQKIAHCF